MLAVDAGAFAGMIGHAYDCYPEEMCGLLAGSADGGRATMFYPCRNTTRSGRVFEIHGMDYQRAEDDADERGLELMAIVHSHTHTEPYPSATDVAQAPDPGWHYVIVGLKRESPETRSYLIVDGRITEEPVTVS